MITEPRTEAGRRLDRWLRDRLFSSTPSEWVPAIHAIEAEARREFAEPDPECDCGADPVHVLHTATCGMWK